MGDEISKSKSIQGKKSKTQPNSSPKQVASSSNQRVVNLFTHNYTEENSSKHEQRRHKGPSKLELIFCCYCCSKGECCQCCCCYDDDNSDNKNRVPANNYGQTINTDKMVIRESLGQDKRNSIRQILYHLRQEQYQEPLLSQKDREIFQRIKCQNQEKTSEEIKENIQFMYQSAKYNYFKEKFQEAVERLKWLLDSTVEKYLEPCNISLKNIQMFLILADYQSKIQQSRIDIGYLDRILELYKKYYFGFEKEQTKEKFINSLICHFKALCRAALYTEQSIYPYRKTKEETIEQPIKYYSNILLQGELRNEQSPLSIANSSSDSIKGLIKVGAASLSPKKQSSKSNTSQLKQRPQHFQSIRLALQKYSEIKQSYETAQLLKSEFPYKQFIFLEETDVKQINKALQDKNDSRTIQPPFLNLKAIYVEADPNKHWMGLYLHKKFVKLSQKECSPLWEITFGVPICFNQTKENSIYSIQATPKNEPQKLISSDYFWKNNFQASNQTFNYSLKPSSSFQPSEGRGLRNLGNTCYMNSALQCLHKSRSFNLAFQKETKNQPLTASYKKLVNELNNYRENSPFAPYEIKSIIIKNNILFEGNGQHDAVEFLSTFLEVMSEELNRCKGQKLTMELDQNNTDEELYQLQKKKDESRRLSIIEDTFVGRYRSIYKCSVCYKKYRLFQKFKVHYIPIPQPQPLYKSSQPCKLIKCLQDFEDPDVMQDTNSFDCYNCKKDTVQNKFMKVYEANKIIIIAFKRFFNGKKNERNIQIPFEVKPSQIVTKTIYILYAALIHRGSINGGHYTAVCFDYLSDKWKYYNDQSVRSISQDRVRSQLQDAYAVFYQLFSERQAADRLAKMKQRSK